MTAQSDTHKPDGDGQTRRDFLYITTGATVVIGGASALWPFIHSMNPAADALAEKHIKLDISSIAEGQAVTAMWRGKPVFIRHRTAAEIKAARGEVIENLPDPQSDEDRTKKPEWLIMLGVCTHLGCIPLGQKPTQHKGEYGGWFCPCHGSHYDTSGRIRKGPAPKNLTIPDYVFESDSVIKIG